MTDLVSAIADAITQVESGGNPNALNFRNNNPGNLVTWGSLPTSQGFAVFPTLAAGRAALESQIQTNINRDLTLYEFFAGKPGVYAGYASVGSSARNNPVAYAQTVAAAVGIDPNTPLNLIQAGGASPPNPHKPS